MTMEEMTMELELFKLTVISIEYGYKYIHNVYGTSEQSILKGWEEYGLNKIGKIVSIERM